VTSLVFIFLTVFSTYDWQRFTLMHYRTSQAIFAQKEIPQKYFCYFLEESTFNMKLL